MGEGLVRLGHLVRVLALLHCSAEAVGGIEDLVHKALGHGLLTTLARVADEPAQRERVAAGGLDLDGHLVGGTADAAATDLELGLDVVDRALERGDRLGAGLLLDHGEGVVDDLLGRGALAALQDLVDELRHNGRAVHRIGDDGLTNAATTNGADVVDKILGVTSTRGATLLADGPLTEGALALLDGLGPTVAVAPADSATAATGAEFTADTAVRRLSPQVVLAPFDPAVGAALAGVGTDPSRPAYLDPAMSVPVDHDSPVARRQDAAAAVLWRMLQPGVEPRAQILLPPLKWSPQPDDARAILTVLANAVRSGLAVPRPLGQLITDSATAVPEEAPQLPADVRGRFDDDVVETIDAELSRLGQLTPALTTDPRTGVTGGQYTAPLREDMLRALSQTEPPQGRNDLARQRLSIVGRTIEDFFGAVRVVSPGDSYTLASERSALPLALRNDLAVPIRVRLQVDAPPATASRTVSALADTSTICAAPLSSRWVSLLMAAPLSLPSGAVPAGSGPVFQLGL